MTVALTGCCNGCWKRHLVKGSDWIRLIFAHPFPLNSGAPIASGNFISNGMVQVTKPKTFCYGYTLGCFIIHTHNEPFPTNGGFVIQDQWVGTIQWLFQSDLLLTCSVFLILLKLHFLGIYAEDFYNWLERSHWSSGTICARVASSLIVPKLGTSLKMNSDT